MKGKKGLNDVNKEKLEYDIEELIFDFNSINSSKNIVLLLYLSYNISNILSILS
jgi:hypothetical protein